jgi:16S rRNA (cytosine1402-N4)-methyltransferase
MKESNYHEPVLLNEILKELIRDKEGIYLDATFGGGGHSMALLNQLNQKARLIALDQDKDTFKKKIIDRRFELFHQNFRNIGRILSFYKVEPLSGILADLGVSSYQINTPSRGFSTRFNYTLDMRMNQNATKTAHQVINKYKEEELISIFKNYGEFFEAKSIVKEILKARQKKEIETTFELTELFEKKIPSFRKAKYFARLFQAIRIEVNDELGALKEFLLQSLSLLKPKGRIAVISYHSLEDTMVKKFFKSGNFEGIISKDFYGNKISPLKSIYSKAIKASQEELNKNPRSRSARLRIAEKL